MKLIIESNGTLKGTKVEFKMTADEIPRMIESHKRKSRLRRKQPEDVVVSQDLPDTPTLALAAIDTVN